jgi:gas vesicle protein
MLMLVLYSWARFFAGLVIGCWVGVMIGCAVALLLAGRRVRKLENLNLLLRLKLNARREPESAERKASGQSLALPRAGGARKADALMGRIARVN